MALYVSTAAPGTLFGDPSEYQFVPAIAGIAHPPGYAVFTLLARAWLFLLPLGTVAYRTNLLSAALGASSVALVFLIGVDLLDGGERAARVSLLGPAFAAAALAVAPDFWQHSIHANSHILSATLAVTHLWLLVRWWRSGDDRWLGGFAFALGLSAAHHPVTLIGAPAYAAFILVTQPRLLRRWRALLALAGMFVAGLLPLLYYPLRSPSAPFGPTNMRTWQGFWQHATAQGLRVNLFHFGLADQGDRALVFWSLLGLQFLLPVIALLPVGLFRLGLRAPKPALLLVAFIGCHLAFTLNTVQDVMAYLLLPLSALAVVCGAGAGALGALVKGALAHIARARRVQPTLVAAAWAALLVVWPLWQGGLNLARGISLRGFTAADDYVAAVHARFDDQRQRARLVSAWEQLTPLWVHAYTQDQPLNSKDVKLVFVSTRVPWGPSVLRNIEKGPVYVPDYRPAVLAAGLRLVPDGRFYRVVRPPAVGFTPTQALDTWADGRVHLLGYDLQRNTLAAGEHLELTLYQSVRAPLDAIWMPYVQLGPLQMRWTTDSRLLTPQWLPGETIVERYEVPVPFNLAPGEYPLRLGYADLSAGRAVLPFSDGAAGVELATITVLPRRQPPPERMLEFRLGQPRQPGRAVECAGLGGLARAERPVGGCAAGARRRCAAPDAALGRAGGAARELHGLHPPAG